MAVFDSTLNSFTEFLNCGTRAKTAQLYAGFGSHLDDSFILDYKLCLKMVNCLKTSRNFMYHLC
jgi:hypothetical protein